MEKKRLARIEEIYHEALDVPLEDRSSFLNDACSFDIELRREVESLLSFAEKDSTLIDAPPLDVAAEMFSHDDHSELIGRQVGHHKIISHIGTGGMGDVFLAEDSQLERATAIKFIKPEIAQMPDQLQRFLQEAKTASTLNHPNIITVYEIGETENIQFIATEYIDGKTLRKEMSENPLTLDKMLDIISQVAAGVHAAHTAGIIHRDIKPENIMLRRDGLVKVLDFGLAKLQKRKKTSRKKEEEKDELPNNSLSPDCPFASSTVLTNPGLMMGTVAYMSPEQARIEQIDKRCDIWSIGVVLYEMCSGRKPFGGETTREKIVSILEKQPAMLAKDVPLELNRIIEKALQKDANERYQTVKELLQDINDLQKKLTTDVHSLNRSSLFSIKQITSPNESRITANAQFSTAAIEHPENTNQSSAEFVFRKVKKHKFFSFGVFALFVIALTTGVYFYSLTNSKQPTLSQEKTDPKAYELFLKGKFYQSKSSNDGLIKALEYFDQAIAIDPNYTKAYTALAATYINIGENSFQNPKEVMPKAKAAAEKALELDDNIAEVHLLMAGIKRTEWDWSGAEREYKRASEINPNLAKAYFSYAFFLSIRGRHAEAVANIKKARALDPLKPHINSDIGYIYYFARRYDRAEEQYDIGLELNPNYGGAYYGKGFLNAARNQYDEAIINYKEMIRLNGDHTGTKCYLGFALARSGKTAEAKAILRELETGNEYVSPVELAILYIGLDEKEKAMSALERSYAERDSQLQYLGIEPHFDALRADARFTELMRRVGLAPENYK